MALCWPNPTPVEPVEGLVERLEHHLLLLRNAFNRSSAIPNCRDLASVSIEIIESQVNLTTEIEQMREALRRITNAPMVLDGGSIELCRRMARAALSEGSQP